MTRTRNLLLTAGLMAALLTPTQAQQPRAAKGSGRPAPAPVRSAVPASPDDKTIVHVLNRIGFGPGPGDVERVRQTGLAAYIDQQLQPERLADAAIASRLAGFTTLRMTTQELAEKYYIPAQMERQLRQRAQQGNAPAAGPERPQPQVAMMTEQQRGERLAFSELAQQKILRAVYSERQLEEV